jgi:putative membrane protein
MNLAISAFVILVALLHLWFLILEIVLWEKPLGLKTFRMTADQAKSTANLAKNQGLYNGFLAAGLIFSLITADPSLASAFQIFFLSCVVRGRNLWCTHGEPSHSRNSSPSSGDSPRSYLSVQILTPSQNLFRSVTF